MYIITYMEAYIDPVFDDVLAKFIKTLSVQKQMSGKKLWWVLSLLPPFPSSLQHGFHNLAVCALCVLIIHCLNLGEENHHQVHVGYQQQEDGHWHHPGCCGNWPQ